LEILRGTALHVVEGGGSDVPGELVVALGAAVGTGTVSPAVETVAVLVRSGGVVGTVRSTCSTATAIVALVATARVGVGGSGAHAGHHLLHLGQESCVACREFGGDGRVDGLDGRFGFRSGWHGVEDALCDKIGHGGHVVGLMKRGSGGGARGQCLLCGAEVLDHGGPSAFGRRHVGPDAEVILEAGLLVEDHVG